MADPMSLRTPSARPTRAKDNNEETTMKEATMKEATMEEAMEISESDLREALEEAAAVNSSSTDTLVAKVAFAHWRLHPTGTPGAIKPDDNDGYAVHLVDQIASGYVITDGPWWISDSDIAALRQEAAAAGDTEQVELCRAALEEDDEAARMDCVDVIAKNRLKQL